MTNLSQRIMDAWLKRNPLPKVQDEPEWQGRGTLREPNFHHWKIAHDKLIKQLECEAFESAVIQFLVPEAVTYEIGNYLFNEAILQLGDETISSCSNASSVAEALLNAIEAIDDTK